MALRATSEPKLRAEMRRETIRTATRELTGMSQPGRTCKITRGGVRLSSVLFFSCEERMGWNGMGWGQKSGLLKRLTYVFKEARERESLVSRKGPDLAASGGNTGDCRGHR